MKLSQLHLFEDRCVDCQDLLTVNDVSAWDKKRCQNCRLRAKKKKTRQDDEEQNFRDREETSEVNLFFTSQQIPDRGYDKDRGTPGWLMGEPSPGRSF